MTTKLSQSGFGVGQTWQNVTGSRARNTLYTNTTGKAIFVHINLGANVNNRTFEVDGVAVTLAEQAVYYHAIVPNGSTYKLNTGAGTPVINIWMEYR